MFQHIHSVLDFVGLFDLDLQVLLQIILLRLVWIRLSYSRVILLDDSAHDENHVRVECKGKQICNTVRQLNAEYRPNLQLRIVSLNAIGELIPHYVQASKQVNVLFSAFAG